MKWGATAHIPALPLRGRAVGATSSPAESRSSSWESPGAPFSSTSAQRPKSSFCRVSLAPSMVENYLLILQGDSSAGTKVEVTPYVGRTSKKLSKHGDSACKSCLCSSFLLKVFLTELLCTEWCIFKHRVAMVINFCDSKKQDLSIPQIHLYYSVERKFSAMNRVTSVVKGSSKNKAWAGIELYRRKHCQNEDRQSCTYANTWHREYDTNILLK